MNGSSTYSWETLKVLIIDDDELIRLTFRNMLKKTQCTILEAKNGNEGLAAYRVSRPDIVITDMLMPEKEGLETISQIRAFDPDAKIIAMSGGGGTKNMSFLELAKKVGANQILSKPVKPDQLFSTINILLQS
jgi:CheY-like chemotaxis protein